MKFSEKSKGPLLEEMIFQCFKACLTFKAQLYHMRTNLLDDMVYSLKIDIPFIIDFVENGIYNTQVAKVDLVHYIETHLDLVISLDDPLIQLRDSYYLNEEDWVKNEYSEMIVNICNNTYPSSFFSLILQVTCTLTSIGFDDTWYSNVENLLKKVIAEHKIVTAIPPSPYYSSDSKEYQRINKSIDVLNDLILVNATNGSVKMLWDAINSENWINELETYLAKEQKHTIATPLFSRIPSNMWVSRIIKSSPGDVYRLRKIIRNVYPDNFISDSLKDDGDSVVSIVEELNNSMNSDKVEDKVLRQNIKWLIKDLNGLIMLIDEYNGALHQ